MADFPGLVQDLEARFVGAANLYVRAYDSAVAIALAAGGADSYEWVNVGSITGLNPQETRQQDRLQGDNAEEEEYVSLHEVILAFTQREALSEDVRAVVRGSFDVSADTAGSLVSGASQVVASGAWGYNDPIVLTNQNGDGSAVTVNSVTGGTDGALVEDTDFFVGTDAQGRTVVTVIDSATVTTEAQTITVNTDYTPTAVTRVFSGGKTALPDFMAKFTNLYNGKLVSFYLWRCSENQGFNFTFQAADAQDPVGGNAVQFRARLDSNITTAGRKLYMIVKERGLAS